MAGRAAGPGVSHRGRSPSGSGGASRACPRAFGPPAASAGRGGGARVRGRARRRLRLGLGITAGMAMLLATSCQTGSVRPTDHPVRVLDALVFGDPASEQAHGLMAARSDVVAGALGQPARRLLPLDPPSWEGGTAAFTLAVDPEQPTYLTVRLWGSDVTETRLIVYLEGKQLGYRHLGDIDILDSGAGEPACNGRFYYATTPLPPSLTKGRTHLACELRSTGRIWAYGGSFEEYQRVMTDPSRGIYRLYTHTDGFFVPPAGESQGAFPATTPVRPEPGPEAIDTVRERLRREIDRQLAAERPLDQMPIQFLAQAYHIPWTAAYHHPAVVTQAVRALDARFVAFRQDPKLAEADPTTYNPDWFGLGPSGDVIRLLAEPLAPFLDVPLDDGTGTMLPRRAAWSEMLRACRDWHCRHRRQYTNQSMINDLYGIYLANRGLAVIDLPNAMPEEAVRRYLYESVGLQPWLGSDGDTGPQKPLGDRYMQLTKAGLTKELGYVGNYGEVLDWACLIYDATRPAPGQPGDEGIRAQLVRLARARAVFRYPALDADGFRAMRLETVVGWRDHRYPGEVTYAQRPSWEASALQVPLATGDPVLIAYAQQMLADNQYYASVQRRAQDTGFRVTAGLLATPAEAEAIRALPPSPHRLPMSEGQADLVFADTENGVLAVKDGDTILYVSLYWRARHAVNFLARVHHITPRFDRIAVVRQETEFEPSGMTYERPDWTDFGFAHGGHRYPGEFHSAHAGEALPIARIPEGVAFRPGDESVYAGRGSFYTLTYGPYLIGMNCTRDRTFPLRPPDGAPAKARDLASGRRVRLDQAVVVPPDTTVVLRLDW